jgi:hypothetical protein
MVDLMYKAIDDTCASFNIYFGKQLSLTDPNFGLKFKIIVILMQWSLHDLGKVKIVGNKPCGTTSQI